MNLTSVPSFLAAMALVFGLALLPAFPEVGNVVTVGIMVVGLGLAAALPGFRLLMRPNVKAIWQ